MAPLSSNALSGKGGFEFFTPDGSAVVAMSNNGGKLALEFCEGEKTETLECEDEFESGISLSPKSLVL